MRYVRRAIVILLVVAAVVVAAGWIYARSSAARRDLRGFVLRELNEVYRIPVEIDQVDFTVYPPSIICDGVRVFHPKEGLFLEASRLTVTPEIWPALRGRYRFEEIAVEEPHVYLRIRDGRIVNMPEPRMPEGREEPTPEVEAFALIDGTLDVTIESDAGPPAYVALTGINLDLTGERNEVFEIRTLATGGSVRWGAAERSVRHVEARVGVTPSALRFRKLTVRLGDDVSFDLARGRIDLTDPPGVVAEVSASAPLSILGDLPESLGLPDVEGRLDVTGTIEYGRGAGGAPVRPDRLGKPGVGGWRSRWTVAIEDARAPGLPIGNLAGAVEVGSEGLRVADLRLDTGIGVLHLDGGVRWDLPGEPFDGTVRMEKLRFAELLERFGVPRSKVVQTFDGNVLVTGSLDPFRIGAYADTDVTDFAIYDNSFRIDDKGMVLDIPLAHVTGGVGVDNRSLRIVPTTVRFGRSRLLVTGAYTFDDSSFLLEIAGDPFATDDVGHLVGSAIAGTGATYVRIGGPIADPVITSRMRFRDFRYVGKAFGDVLASLHYQGGVLRFPEIQASVGDSKYDVFDLTFDFRDERYAHWTAAARVAAHPIRVADVPHVLQGQEDRFAPYDGWFDGDADILYRSWTDDYDVRFEAHGRKVTIRGEPVDALAARGRYRGRRFEIPFFRLERLGGWVEGTASVSSRGAFAADVRGAGVPIGRIFGGVVGELGLTASASFQFAARGTPDDFTGEGVVSLADAVLLDQPLGEVDLELRILPGERLHAWGTVAAGATRINAVADLEPRLRVGVEAEFADLAPLPFLGDPRTDPYELVVSGRTALVVDTPPGGTVVRGKAELSDLVFTAPQGTVRSIGPVRIGFTEEGVEIHQAELEMPGGSRMSVLGEVSMDTVDVDARGEADLATLLALFPGAPEVEGRIEFGARVTGSPHEPTLVGTARITDGRLLVGRSFGDVEDIGAELTFTPTRVSIDRATAEFLGGNVRAEGVITLSGLRPERYDVAVDFGGMSYPLTPTLPVAFDGTVRVVGDRSEDYLPLVTGDVYLTRLAYTDPVRLGVSLGSLGRTRVEPIATFRPQDDFVRFDVRIHADSGISVRNNVLEASVRIDETSQPFRAVGSNQVYGLVGTAVIEHGRLAWRHSVFDVTRGAVYFDSPWKIDPRFDIVAETEVRDWRITLTAAGRRDDLTILTTSQPELSDEDIVLLLAIGMTRAEAEMLGAGAGVGGALLAEVFGEAIGVSDRIDRFVPIVDQMRVTTEYSTRTGRTDPRITVGRRITDDVRIEASSSFTDTRDFRAVFSYEVTDRMSVEGVYDNNNDYQFGNVGADVRWRIEF